MQLADNGRVGRIVIYLFLIAIDEYALLNELLTFSKVVDMFDV